MVVSSTLRSPKLAECLDAGSPLRANTEHHGVYCDALVYTYLIARYRVKSDGFDIARNCVFRVGSPSDAMCLPSLAHVLFSTNCQNLRLSAMQDESVSEHGVLFRF